VHRESALRSLRYHSCARTNHFEVEHSLEGLEEKFRVYNQDATADILHQRLQDLDKCQTKWKPELLHLLLELSDKPVEKTKLSSLDSLKAGEHLACPALKWEDLVADDLRMDRSIWKDIDYTAGSSEDEGSIDSHHNDYSVTESTTVSSVDESDYRRPQDFQVLPNTQLLPILQKAQYWIQDDEAQKFKDRFEIFPQKVIPISELQALREVLFMFLGVATSIFQNEDGCVIKSSLDYVLSHSSPHTFHSMSNGFAEQGTAITVLRAWVKENQNVPLLQALQAGVANRLHEFDVKISEIQGKYVAPKSDVLISLLNLQKELGPKIRPLCQLSNIIRKLKIAHYSHAFYYLELLYDEISSSQMAGDDSMYTFMGILFFECFRIYLRPIRAWMEHGELQKEDNVFFVSEVNANAELASLWNDRFKLRTTPSGLLHAPKFLHTTASKIFISGKSVVVLKQLGRHHGSFKDIEEPQLNFISVTGPDQHSLAPFSELFDVAFDGWVQSKHHTASSTLTRCLFDNCGLRVSLEAMEHLYFLADGSTASGLTDSIFRKLDGLKNGWNDRYFLTELARGTFSSSTGVKSENIRIAVALNKYNTVQKARTSVKALIGIALGYRLPWPVHIIITKETIKTYQSIFTFLLQVRRSTYMLESVRLLNDQASSDSGLDERSLYYGLRSRLLWFNSTLYNYLTDLVIRANTAQMHQSLADAQDVDEMIQVHRSYISRLTEQGLLGTGLEPIRKTLYTILDLSIHLNDARNKHTTSQNMSDTSILSRSLWQGRPKCALDMASSDEEDEDYADFSAISVVQAELSYIDDLRKMRGQFDHLSKFVATGLRGVARAGGEPSWDILAEKLEGGF